jgi:hypothetical protein
LHPWDVDRLSSAEWNRYLEALEQIDEQARKSR